MYFIVWGRQVCHILSDLRNGASPCGAKVSNSELWKHTQGRVTMSIMEERPLDVPLCKLCERQQAGAE